MIPTLYQIPLPKPTCVPAESPFWMILSMIVATAFWYLLLVAFFGAIQ